MMSRVAIQLSWWLLTVVPGTLAGIACLGNPCSHGICIDDVNSTYSCYCLDGYTGVQCQTNWNECWSSPCYNGGTCLDGVASYNCSCADGFIGDNCEINYNECESNPCSNNGTCVDLANGYVCSCLPGYAGEHCEVDAAVCNSTEEVRCYNGGQCIEGPGFKFYCKCLPGWTGAKCEDAIDECKSNPCNNGGVCIDIHADYMCACTFGFTGKSCEVQIQFCDENSCSNNAICVLEDEMKVCYCVPDYHGEKCELQYDECLLGPRCMNGGTCIDGIDNFTCSCPPKLTGVLCECLMLNSGELQCDYVSPTPIPGITDTTFTVAYSDLVSTGHDTVSYVTMGINFNISNATTELIESALSTFETITTSQDNKNLTTVTDKSTTEEGTTSVSITSSTLPINKEVTLESERENTVTIDSESYVTETTTSCKEGCKKTTTEITTLNSLNNIDFTTTTAESITVDTYSTTETSQVVLETTDAVSTESTLKETSEITTVKFKVTSDKMFTDSPTDQMTAEITTPVTFYTTSELDTTTLDNVTRSYATVQSECSDSMCHDHGKCITTSHEIVCHCRFNYGGKFCNEKNVISTAAFGANSYLSHRLNNNTSINIVFDARTLISEGQLMYVDIAKEVYMKLYMLAGLLKFKFSCGYQTMLLSELKTFVNKGFQMKIEISLDLDFKNQYCNATLRLNHTVAMSGGQIANISYLPMNSILYLGNAPDIKDVEIVPFIGCIRDLMVNSQKREIFGDAFDGAEVSECFSLHCLSGPCRNGGSCEDHEDSFTCACSNGWIGDHCDVSVCDHNPCQYGGTCVRHPGSGFLCICPLGKHGIFCEHNVQIARPSFAPIAGGVSSFIVYSLPQAVNSERFDFRFRFQTNDLDQISLLAFVGQNGQHDSRSQHLAVTFVKGYIMLTWNMGSGARRIFTPRALSTRRGGHWVRVGRRGRAAWLAVDGNFNVSGNAPGPNTKMTVLPYIYIGGHPSIEFNLLPHDLPLHQGWRGCVWEVGGGGVGGSSRTVTARGVGQCGVVHCSATSCNAPNGVCIHHPATYGCICNEGWFGATCSMLKNPCDRSQSSCHGRCVISTDPRPYCDCPYGTTGPNCSIEMYPTDVLFNGIRSYIRLKPHTISSVRLALELDIKPEKARGLILFADTPHFYTSLSLQGALLEYRWTERVSGVSSVVSSRVVLGLGEWHRVRAGHYGATLYVWADGAIATTAMLAHAAPHTKHNASILLGGAEDLSTLPFDVMLGPPESYNGCIRNLHVNDIMIPLEKQNIEDGINLEDCDGTPCGGETCGTGTCTIDAGVARCLCSGAGSSPSDKRGTRCRRQALCTPKSCKSPKGTCKNGKCVCAAGFYGDNCAQRLNVTIPQFHEGSLLMLSYKSLSDVAKMGQRLENSRLPPNYLTLNFTTAEPRGLILWIAMDEDYLGIGLDDGLIKLVWSLRQVERQYGKQDSNITKSHKIFSQILPEIGVLADADWHVLTVIIEERNITLWVDELIAYREKPGVGDVQYNSVEIYLGGTTNKEQSAKKIFPTSFVGCIDNIATNREYFISNFTQHYSENIKSCQLFP